MKGVEALRSLSKYKSKTWTYNETKLNYIYLISFF